MSISILLKKVSTAMAGAAFLSVIAVITKPAQASSILYFNDYNVGIDAMGQALLDSGNTVTTATNSINFESMLKSGSYDLGIFFVQGFSATNYASTINALGLFVKSGGKSMYTDWSNNNDLAAQFGAGFTGKTNYSQVNLTDSKYALGTYNLSNPGWGTYSTGLTALRGSTVVAKANNGDAAIVIGNEGRSITFGFLADSFADTNQGKKLFASFLTQLSSPIATECSIN